MPWYAAGLAFECTECGRCCSGPEEGYVWINEEEIRTAAASISLTVDQFIATYVHRVGRRMSLRENPDTADCVFLRAGGDGRKRCAIYAVRPTQCRTWPFWRANISSPKEWSLAALRCPGINRGRLLDRNHIERQSHLTS